MKNSFVDQMQKGNFTNQSNVTIINQTQSFLKTNDITSKNYNPVINKIANFMAKKEKKISSKSVNT